MRKTWLLRPGKIAYARSKYSWLSASDRSQADGKQIKILRMLHANVQEYFAQNYNSRESLFSEHKDIEQSLHRALKDADESNLPEIASLLMAFTSGGSVTEAIKEKIRKARSLGPPP